MSKTKLIQKLYLFLFGIFLALILLEAGLRLGGFLFLSAQELANRASLKNGEYRIVCVGESTTALGGESAYPRQLENILNSKQSKIKFTVINKGIPATNTDKILSRIEEYLNQYKPQMVVSMMGINDDDLPASSAGEVAEKESFWKELRVYKLTKLLYSHLTHKQEEIKISELDKNVAKIEATVNQQPSLDGYKKLSLLYRALNKPEKEKDALLKAIALNQRDYEAQGFLGLYYQNHGEYEKAVTALKEAFLLSPADLKYRMEILSHLAACYKLVGDYDQAIDIYMTILNAVPDYPDAYGNLGEISLEEKKYDVAEKYFIKQISINPKATWFYGKLAHCYRVKGLHDKAEDLLMQAIQINPEDLDVYLELGYCLFEDKKYEKAETVFKKILDLNKDDAKGVNDSVYDHLIEVYEAQSKFDMARSLKKLLLDQSNKKNLRIYTNYQKLKRILARRKVQLGAVQYALRDVRSLERMLEPLEGIVLVDNKKIFEDAVKQSGFDDYFYDRFAGDFGHCTAKGNYLLADNVAKAICNYLNIPIQ